MRFVRIRFVHAGTGEDILTAECFIPSSAPKPTLWIRSMSSPDELRGVLVRISEESDVNGEGAEDTVAGADASRSDQQWPIVHGEFLVRPWGNVELVRSVRRTILKASPVLITLCVAEMQDGSKVPFELWIPRSGQTLVPLGFLKKYSQSSKFHLCRKADTALVSSFRLCEEK